MRKVYNFSERVFLFRGQIDRTTDDLLGPVLCFAVGQIIQLLFRKKFKERGMVLPKTIEVCLEHYLKLDLKNKNNGDNKNNENKEEKKVL